jgi:hypothetical protein
LIHEEIALFALRLDGNVSLLIELDRFNELKGNRKDLLLKQIFQNAMNKIFICFSSSLNIHLSKLMTA